MIFNDILMNFIRGDHPVIRAKSGIWYYCDDIWPYNGGLEFQTKGLYEGLIRVPGTYNSSYEYVNGKWEYHGLL